MVTIDPAISRHIDFPGKDREEAFQFYFRQHWIRLWWPLRRLLLWIVIVGIGAFITNVSFVSADETATRHAMIVVLCVALLASQLSFIASFYKYFLYVIIVTDKRVHRIKKTLLTVDDHQSIDLWTLEDITKNQHGIVQNIFGFGTLVLVMPTQDALRVHFTPHISTKYEVIMQLREHARARLMPQQAILSPYKKIDEAKEATDL